MLWFEAFHVIAMVCWFAGLFYLPRLFVYHAASQDPNTIAQFKIMEHRLYYYITTPAAILTIIFGCCLWFPRYEYYSHFMWMHIKLIAVLGLCIFHVYCGYLLKQFSLDKNQHSERFYRLFNEIPTIVLILVIIMVIVKPGL